MKSGKSRLALAVVFLIVAVAILVFQFTNKESENSSPSPQKDTGIEIKPSGKVIEVDSKGGKTIQSAIDSANFGDKVFVKSGTYIESLNLKDGIILEGQDANTVIIKSDFRMAPVLTVNDCRMVYVSGLTLTHLAPVLDEKIAGNWPIVQINNSCAKIDNLIVFGSTTRGIQINNDPGRSDHVTVTDCMVYNNNYAGIFVIGCGNAEIKNNICLNNKRSGIAFKDFSQGVVINNICKNNLYGLAAEDCAKLEVRANTFHKNQNCGIWHNSVSSLDVADNNCCDNGKSGIEICGQKETSITSNHCSNNGINGIYVMNGTRGVISNNTCSENKWHGISVGDNCPMSVGGNRCFDNKKCGLYSLGTMISQNETYGNGEFYWMEVYNKLNAGDYNDLEKLASSIRDKKKRFSDGRWQLNYFYQTFAAGNGDGKWADNLIRLTAQWTAKCPNSVTSRIAMAVAEISKAWQVRGSGYGITVSPEAWQLFGEHLKKANEILKEAEKLNTKDPALFAEWIAVGMGLGDANMIEAAFNKGIAIEPDYYALHFKRCYAYLPKWLGTKGQYEKCAAQSADLTKDKLGDSFYFRLACDMTGQVKDINEFKDTNFDFKRVMQGAKDYSKLFPDFIDSHVSNKLCFMACACGDKESAKDYFMDIGDQWNENLWESYDNFNKYKSWARSRE
ncbi:MAG: right-handed parallel beta-helix repeat-containing protein [Phycisphaerales bacterium]